MTRSAFAIGFVLVALGGTAFAEDATVQDTAEANTPRRGTFDAGGKLRFPNGPDEMGQFAQFNWVAVDLQGRYFVLDQLSLEGLVLTAPVHQDLGMTESKIFGGFLVGPTLNLDKAFGIDVKLGALTQNAVLLSAKDAPIYVGDLDLAAKLGPWIKLHRFGLDLDLVPQVTFQNTDDKIVALQVPVSAAVSLGRAFKLAAEVGIYTGDDLDPRPSQGGRIAAGAAIDVKVGHILVHAGAGFASLLTTDDPSGGNLYSSIGDSVYVDLDAKYVK